VNKVANVNRGVDAERASRNVENALLSKLSEIPYYECIGIAHAEI